jgi:hypothetical protein
MAHQVCYTEILYKDYESPLHIHDLPYVKKFVFLLGGKTGAKLNKEVFKYSLAENEWTEKAPMKFGAFSFNVIPVFRSYLYVFDTSNGNRNDYFYVQRYCVKNDEWRILKIK